MDRVGQCEQTDSAFHLYFNEGFHQEQPRRCTKIKGVSFGAASETAALLVRIDPPCSGDLYRVEDRKIGFLILSALFSGQSFFPVAEWPMQVHIYLPLMERPELRDHINVAEAKNIALGEIRRVTAMQGLA